MKLRQVFNSYADYYDDHFTRSVIGKAQRSQVWRILKLYIRRKLNILEINCGTGEDALRLASLRHRVLATDISDKMIKICKQKQGFTLPDLVFIRSAFQELDQRVIEGSFDLIFSNFGGLNCLSPEDTKTMIPVFFNLLKPGGRLFLVYMSPNCQWEKFYYWLKRKPSLTLRRHMEGSAKVRIGGFYLDIWYYSPRSLEKLYAPYFLYEKIYPIGLFVPPTFLEHYFIKHKRILRLLEWVDKVLGFPGLARFSDHFAVVFKKHVTANSFAD